jgi:hypothetical protein
LSTNETWQGIFEGLIKESGSELEMINNGNSLDEDPNSQYKGLQVVRTASLAHGHPDVPP